MHSENLNYYEVLEVAPDATQEYIFEAYKNALSTFSLSNPELFKVFSPEEAKVWVQLIEEAYAVIGFPNTRRSYDLELKTALKSHFPSNEAVDGIDVEISDESMLPEGYAQTKISRYLINRKLEEQIEKQELFDGIFLKKIREYKCIDLTDFSVHTCIAIRHLYAIENNNFSVLPAAVFVRGYVIQYCRTLGLDDKRVLPSFMNLLKNAQQP